MYWSTISGEKTGSQIARVGAKLGAEKGRAAFCSRWVIVNSAAKVSLDPFSGNQEPTPMIRVNEMIKHVQTCAFALLALGAAPLASAQQATMVGKITAVHSGWYGEGLAIALPAVGQLGSGCPEGAGHFAIAATHPGYKEMAAMIVSAFASKVDTKFIVDTAQPCFMWRTKVIAVSIER